MKRTCKVVMVIMLIASLMTLTSCDGLFTKSMMKGAARDPGKAAEALAKKPTTELVNDASEVADRAQAEAIVGALSAQARNDENFAANLTDEEKQTIITAATTAVIDLASLGGSITDAMNAGDDADEDAIMESMIDNMIGGLGDADTACVAAILADSLDDTGGLDANEEMYSSLTLGAVAVAASAIKSANGDDYDAADVVAALDGSAGSDPMTQAEALIGNTDSEEYENMVLALMTLQALQANGYEFNQAFGMGNN